jgi:hypothetical protein
MKSLALTSQAGQPGFTLVNRHDGTWSPGLKRGHQGRHGPAAKLRRSPCQDLPEGSYSGNRSQLPAPDVGQGMPKRRSTCAFTCAQSQMNAPKTLRQIPCSICQGRRAAGKSNGSRRAEVQALRVLGDQRAWQNGSCVVSVDQTASKPMRSAAIAMPGTSCKGTGGREASRYIFNLPYC